MILGVNIGQTSSGKLLRDGGAAVLCGNNVCHIFLEERVSRIKRAGGYDLALKTLLGIGYNLDQFDTVAISSCCESLPKLVSVKEFSKVEVIAVNHHLSHAIGTYALSPFDTAIVVVMDAGGNTFEESLPEWWLNKREQNSYFIASQEGVQLIDRDFDNPLDAGFGEVYRAFTYFLGWKSSQHAGKTMALSSYGDAEVFKDMPIYKFDSEGHLHAVVQNNPLDPCQMVTELLDMYGITNISPRQPDEPILNIHKNLAAWVQHEMESALDCRIRNLIKQTGFNKICLTGGVAYNCKMNGFIANINGAENVYVQPASGDQGQCLGNAVYAQSVKNNKVPKLNFQPYLGSMARDGSVKEILSKYPNLHFVDCLDISKAVASLISGGSVVCRFHGKSEFGPRALGNRSILADPRRVQNKYLLNKIKSRDPFMPFAPSVLYEFATDYFDGVAQENYMTTATVSKWDKRKFIPAVIHKDGTSRIHLVKNDVNPEYYRLIHAFYEITKIPMLLNTSFNRKGEPIVETIDDAISCFNAMPISYLIIGDYLIQKDGLFNIDKQCSNSYGSTFTSICKTTELSISNFTNTIPIYRHKFNLYHEYIDWLYYGRKVTTIRYKPNGFDYPCFQCLPMYETEDFSFNNKSDKYVGHVEIGSIEVKQFGQLDHTDAVNDGFKSLEELKTALTTIYTNITETSYVTIYHIYLNTALPQHV